MTNFKTVSGGQGIEVKDTAFVACTCEVCRTWYGRSLCPGCEGDNGTLPAHRTKVGETVWVVAEDITVADRGTLPGVLESDGIVYVLAERV